MIMGREKTKYIDKRKTKIDTKEEEEGDGNEEGNDGAVSSLECE